MGVKGTFNKLERPYTEALEMAKVKLEEEGVPAEYPELSFDPNAMAAMFQDPNMVQLMASLFTAKEKQSVTGAAADAGIGTCFTEPEFNPLANPYYPGSNFSNSFGNFLLAQQENPELQYRSQIQALKSMGFVDVDANVQALLQTDGNVTRAIEVLLEQQEPWIS